MYTSAPPRAATNPAQKPASAPKLPLVQPGDSVTGSYLNTGGTVVAFKTFDDLSISLGTSTPVTIPTSTPGALATPTPTPKR